MYGHTFSSTESGLRTSWQIESRQRSNNSHWITCWQCNHTAGYRCLYRKRQRFPRVLPRSWQSGPGLWVQFRWWAQTHPQGHCPTKTDTHRSQNSTLFLYFFYFYIISNLIMADLINLMRHFLLYWFNWVRGDLFVHAPFFSEKYLNFRGFSICSSYGRQLCQKCGWALSEHYVRTHITEPPCFKSNVKHLTSMMTL